MSHITIISNGQLAYDSACLTVYAMQQILIEEADNKGGTCTIIMPADHPAASLFPAFRTPVTIYRDDKLRFRGRPLPLSEDTYGTRTIVLEGELCWLNDAIIRPYLYQTDPATIFTDVIAQYNTAVEPWKQFRVGTITVTDPNDYARVESSSAMTAQAVVVKLLDRFGGHIHFSTAADGARLINWYADHPYACSQVVDLEQNLISYSKESALEQFATRVIPYGAEQSDGTRLTINVDGRDYIQDDEAVKLRGVIEASVVFEDITLEKNLISRAASWLQTARLIPETITLNALDLSKIGVVVDSFRVGQRVECRSAPHELSGLYDLTALTEDLCDSRIGSVTLGATRASLIGSESDSRKDLDKRLDLIDKKVTETDTSFNDFKTTSKEQETAIYQNVQEIVLAAQGNYVEKSAFESYQEQSKAELAISEKRVEIAISENVRKEVQEGDDRILALYNELRMNYDFTADGQYIGKKDSDTMMRLVNDMMQILVAGIAATTVDRNGLTADQANIKTLRVGEYTLAHGNDGHLMLT